MCSFLFYGFWGTVAIYILLFSFSLICRFARSDDPAPLHLLEASDADGSQGQHAQDCDAGRREGVSMMLIEGILAGTDSRSVSFTPRTFS